MLCRASTWYQRLPKNEDPESDHVEWFGQPIKSTQKTSLLHFDGFRWHNPTSTTANCNNKKCVTKTINLIIQSKKHCWTQFPAFISIDTFLTLKSFHQSTFLKKSNNHDEINSVSFPSHPIGMPSCPCWFSLHKSTSYVHSTSLANRDQSHED